MFSADTLVLQTEDTRLHGAIVIQTVTVEARFLRENRKFRVLNSQSDQGTFKG